MKAKHLIWLQTGFLGDIVITTAAFRFVREHFPEVRQTLITTPIGAAALKAHPDLDRILTFDKRGRTLLAEARRLKAELKGEVSGETWILQTHRSFRSSFLCRLLGLPTVTYHETQCSFLAKRTVPRIAVWHEAQRILILLEALGVKRELMGKVRPYLSPQTGHDLSEELRAFAGRAPLVAIAPGSVWGTKRWPSEYYGRLAQILLKQSQAKLVILGSKEEMPAAAEVEKMAAHADRCLNLAGKTSLDDLRAVFPQLSLLISNDSSPLHYASGFNIPTFAIFGATVPSMGFGPLAENSWTSGRELPCRPCSDHGPKTCPLGHFRCMLDQKPELLAQELLGRYPEVFENNG